MFLFGGEGGDHERVGVGAHGEAIGVVGVCSPGGVAAETALHEVNVEECVVALVAHVAVVHLHLFQAGVEVERVHVKCRYVERLHGIDAHSQAGAVGERCFPHVGVVAGFLRTDVGIENIGGFFAPASHE